MPFVIFRRDHLRFTSGIICGSGSFAVQFGDHFRSGDHLRPGIICGAVQNKTNLKFRLGVMRAPSPFILILILSVVAFSLRYSSTCSFISSFTALTFAPVAFPCRPSIWQIFAYATAVMYEIVRHVSAFFSIYLPYFVSRLHECRVSTDKQNWSLEYP